MITRHNAPTEVPTDVHGCPTRRPTHVAHPAVDYMCGVMRSEGRDDLVHYAGASYRDDIAWQMCRVWFNALRETSEADLKARAIKLAEGSS